MLKIERESDTLFVIRASGQVHADEMDAELDRLIEQSKDIKGACSKLIERANSNGGPDNITVVLAKVMGTG